MSGLTLLDCSKESVVDSRLESMRQKNARIEQRYKEVLRDKQEAEKHNAAVTNHAIQHHDDDDDERLGILGGRLMSDRVSVTRRLGRGREEEERRQASTVDVNRPRGPSGVPRGQAGVPRCQPSRTRGGGDGRGEPAASSLQSRLQRARRQPQVQPRGQQREGAQGPRLDQQRDQGGEQEHGVSVDKQCSKAQEDAPTIGFQNFVPVLETAAQESQTTNGGGDNLPSEPTHLDPSHPTYEWDAALFHAGNGAQPSSFSDFKLNWTEEVEREELLQQQEAEQERDEMRKSTSMWQNVSNEGINKWTNSDKTENVTSTLAPFTSFSTTSSCAKETETVLKKTPSSIPSSALDINEGKNGVSGERTQWSSLASSSVPTSRLPSKFLKQRPTESNRARLESPTYSEPLPVAKCQEAPSTLNRATVFVQSFLLDTLRERSQEIKSILNVAEILLIKVDNLFELRSKVGEVDPEKDSVVIVHVMDEDALEVALSDKNDIDKTMDCDLYANTLFDTMEDFNRRIPYLRLYLSTLLPRFDHISRPSLHCPNNVRKVINVQLRLRSKKNPVVELINNDSVLDFGNDVKKGIQCFRQDGTTLTAKALETLIQHWLVSFKDE